MFYTVSKLLWLVAVPSTALVLVTATGIFLSILRKPKHGAWLAIVGICGLILGSFTPVGLWLATPLENRFPQWQIGTYVAPNGIILLGGNHEAGFLALIELSQRFPKARLLLSGVSHDLSDSEDLRNRFALVVGSPTRLVFETRSRTTAENASYAKQLVDPRPDEHWLLITSAMHMPRAVGSFRRDGFQIEAYPINFKTRHKMASLSDIETSSKAIDQFDAATKEWIGLIAYRITGRTNALFPAP